MVAKVSDQQVLDAARRLEMRRHGGGWSAHSIQRDLFPCLNGYCADSVGISAAIRRLVARGMIRRLYRGAYVLTVPVTAALESLNQSEA